jgi:hypothetical protein
MIEKIHHIGIAVHSLEDARVILSDDHVCPRRSIASRRNLGSGRRPGAASSLCSQTSIGSLST